MKTKEISFMLGVPPATLFDWSKSGHKKQKLAELLKKLSTDDVSKLLEQSTHKPKPMMLLSTVNCSIGDKSKHFTLTSLKKLFYKQDKLNVYEKYALKTIKHEALDAEIQDFMAYYKIPSARVDRVLSA